MISFAGVLYLDGEKVSGISGQWTETRRGTTVELHGEFVADEDLLARFRIGTKGRIEADSLDIDVRAGSSRDAGGGRCYEFHGQGPPRKADDAGA